MTNSEKIYTVLCSLFSVLIVVGNLIYQKFISIDFLSLYTFELGAGAVLYPVTFLLTDLIAEFYGKEKANFCVKIAILMNIVTVIIVTTIGALPATHWSPVDDSMFHKVFGLYSLAFIASIVACYTAQIIDVIIYLWIKKTTKGKFLWLRSNGSTAISLFIDTFIVITLLTIFGVIPMDKMWSLIGNSYIFKLFFTICSTPVFYLMVSIIKVLIHEVKLKK